MLFKLKFTFFDAINIFLNLFKCIPLNTSKYEINDLDG